MRKKKMKRRIIKNNLMLGLLILLFAVYLGAGAFLYERVRNVLEGGPGEIVGGKSGGGQEF